MDKFPPHLQHLLINSHPTETYTYDDYSNIELACTETADLQLRNGEIESEDYNEVFRSSLQEYFEGDLEMSLQYYIDDNNIRDEDEIDPECETLKEMSEKFNDFSENYPQISKGQVNIVEELEFQIRQNRIHKLNRPESYRSPKP